MQMLWLKGLQREVIGQVFETGVFAELVKKYSGESVFYWRTKDKKEIDFILKMKDSLIPIEVKLNYEQFNPTAIRYFNGAGRCSKPSKLVLHPSAMWIKELGKSKLMILSNVLQDTSAATSTGWWRRSVTRTALC
ncbi:MAG: DUF4143 domain-containing protein [Deltaproteobacteria bacterium]|nr:DUF4143 domain-containing protein [Deltaproteobacteria bacterium]